MPKFVLTFLLTLLVSLGILFRTIFYSSPEQILNLGTFFAALFFLDFSLISLFSYLIITLKVRDLTTRRSLFRQTLWLPFLVTAGFLAILGLKVLGAFNLINLLLLTTLLILSALYSSR